MRLLYPLVIALSLGCTSVPSQMEVMEDPELTTVWGPLAGPPRIEADNNRLFLFIDAESVEVCVAENEEENEILARVAERVVATHKDVYCFGRRVEGPWNEYLEGYVDVEAVAIAYWAIEVRDYAWVHTDFGESAVTALESFTFLDFLNLIKEASKKAM